MNQYQKKGFSLSLISLALLSQTAIANDFVNYTGPDSNPVRTVEEALKLQQAHINRETGLDKDRYRYPEGSYYSVFYATDGVPGETVISLSSFLENHPNKLAIENYHFTLDKALPNSELISVHQNQEVKFTNGKVTVGTNVEIPNMQADFGITVFDLEKGARISLNNVDVDMLNTKTPASILELYQANGTIDKSNINVVADDFRYLFDLEDSTLNAKDLTINLSGDKLSLGVVGTNSDIKIENSHIQAETNNENTMAIFSVNDSDMDILNSTILAKNKVIGFSNFADFYDDKLDRPQNTVNLTHSTFASDDILIQLGGHLSEEDDEEKAITSPRFVFNASDSKLTGRTTIIEPNSALALNLANNSQWNVTGNSEVTTLDNQNSDVVFDKGEFHTLTVNDLSGNGRFTLRSDLANQKSDQIIVKGKAEGSHSLTIKDFGNEPQAADGKVTLVKTSGNSKAQFSLKDRDYVDAGAYRYRLSKDGNDWILSNKASEPSKPVEPSQPIEPTTPIAPVDTVTPTQPSEPTAPIVPVPPVTQPTDTATVIPTEPSTPPMTPIIEQRVLSEKTNALVSLRQAQLLQLEQGLAGIHQRLGELKQGESGNVWVRNLNTRSELGSTHTATDSQSSGFTQDFHGVQIGADKVLSDNFRLGGFVSSERSSLDFNGSYGTGKVSGQSVGLYTTYHANNSWYIDNIAKFSRLKVSGTGVEGHRNNAYTLSSEIGKIFTFGDQWTLTPNAQLAWTSIAGNEDADRLSALYSRVGARLAKDIDLGGWKLQPYTEVNGVTSKNHHSQVRVNQHRFDVASSRGRIEGAFGINITSGSHRFGLEGKVANGKHLDQPFSFQANYRYSW